MRNTVKLTRRAFGIGAVSLAGMSMAGCARRPGETLSSEGYLYGSTRNLAADGLPRQGAGRTELERQAALMYGPLPDERFPIPAVHLEQLEPRFYRQQVPYETGEKVGTLVVDTSRFYCYLVGENGMAMRYGVGLGRAGFAWSGRATVGWKQKWPKWTPPDEMIARQPELEKYSAANGSMPPGLRNPLGARALYLFQDGKDTLYRLHGSEETFSIGKAVSSGCVRFINQDIIDLYDRVPTGSKVVVI